jgi:hypothetical protein
MSAPTLVDDAPIADADPPRVILIDSAPPPPGQRSDGGRQRPEPWTPRATSEPQAPVRQEGTSLYPTAQPSLQRRHRMMFAALCAFCIATVLGTLTWRLAAGSGDQPAPPNGASAPGPRERPGGVEGPGLEGAEGAEAGLGAVATEIVVLQPNYTVAPGDTLAAIARRHGTSIEALASINQLENRNSLSVVQRLILP